MGEAHNIAPTLFEVVELLLFSRWLFVLDIDSFGFFYFMPTIDWLNLDIILFSFIKRLNRAIYENNSEKKKKKTTTQAWVPSWRHSAREIRLTVSPHRFLFLEKANTMGPTTPFKIGHKWGDGYFYHFTARVYFFTFTLRLKEKLLRLNIFYDYRLRFVNFYALRFNLFAVSSVWVNPIKILLKLKNRLMMKKNKFFTPKIRKGKKGYPFSLFFGGPSLVASQIKTEEEISWVKPTPFEVSY